MARCPICQRVVGTIPVRVRVGSNQSMLLVSVFFVLFYFKILFIFRQRGREEEREGNSNVWLPVTHLARNPGMCPDREWNPQPFSSQAGAQSPEPHQPGLGVL